MLSGTARPAVVQALVSPALEPDGRIVVPGLSAGADWLLGGPRPAEPVPTVTYRSGELWARDVPWAGV